MITIFQKYIIKIIFYGVNYTLLNDLMSFCPQI
nr:MAG TPA: hypothetical protein [Caudoviricetes sp.]DAR86267.1 MAG TPA: hypothetical protein [Caudoviricetes sp.]DAS32490.1 MAG TPA: hypothetical protein [Caudoviricetes sp.]DAT89188.1 MAG TPA: hypothetical protein [Caudoviricetes sp.]DAX54616.1 MAG TPA: hypothetical protein [Caudoviricetes sp.]